MLNKKQIVFIEPKPTVSIYRIARSLRLTGKYETILFSFSEVDKEFYKKAYDKIFVLELSHKLKFKTLTDFFNKILNKKVRGFLKKIEEMKPYIFQITGPDIFSSMVMRSLRKNPSPKIYYSNDLWSADVRNFFFTRKFWIKGEIQKFCEKRCFRESDGALNKMSIREYELFNYQVNIPKMALPPWCLDEWTFAPKKKKNKEIHIGYAGSPNTIGSEEISFMKVIKILSQQKIYLHTYGKCLNEEEDKEFSDEAKRNKHYIKHERVTPIKLNEEMSEYNYGIFPEFHKQSVIDSNPTLKKTLLCSRMINYLESGLPMIANKQDEYMAQIIRKYGLGFELDPKNLENLRKILEGKNYSRFQKNVKKFQKEFRLSKKIKDIEAFYDKIAKMKKQPS